MAKLKVNLDVLEETIRVYSQEIDNLRDARRGVQKALNTLKHSGWDSNAGQRWFALLDDEWLENFNFQIRVFGHLRDDLEIAQNEYQDVYDEQQRLERSLQ